MGQIIGIDTYVELQQHVVMIAVNGMTSGKSTVHGIVTHILQSSSAFGCDDVSRDHPQIPTGWNLGTDLKGGEYEVLVKVCNEMFINGIIEGKPVGKNAMDIAQLGAMFGRDAERRRKAVAEAMELAEAILNGSVTKLAQKGSVEESRALAQALCNSLENEVKAGKAAKGDDWFKSPGYEQWLQKADNFLEFMLNNFTPEICVEAARTAISKMRLPFNTLKMKNFEKFAGSYVAFIVA